MNKSQQNKIKWYMLSFMCFSPSGDLENVLNGFVYFNGTQVIFSWILMFGTVLCTVRTDGRRAWFRI